MRWVKFIAMLVLVALLLSVGPGVARADAPDYSNPAVAQALSEQLAKAGDKAGGLWVSYPPEAKQAVTKFNTVVRLTRSQPQTSGAATILATGCRNGSEIGITGYNYLNQPLFSFFVGINYCFNGRTHEPCGVCPWSNQLSRLSLVTASRHGIKVAVMDRVTTITMRRVLFHFAPPGIVSNGRTHGHGRPYMAPEEFLTAV